MKRSYLVALAIMSLAPVLSACAATTEQAGLDADRDVFQSPYANQWIAEARVDPASDNPANVICNGDRCFLLNGDGEFILMSREERRGFRQGIRLAEQNRRFNEGIETPADPPEGLKPVRPGRDGPGRGPERDGAPD